MRRALQGAAAKWPPDSTCFNFTAVEVGRVLKCNRPKTEPVSGEPLLGSSPESIHGQRFADAHQDFCDDLIAL